MDWPIICRILYIYNSDKGLICLKLTTNNINTNYNVLNENDSKTDFLHEISLF